MDDIGVDATIFIVILCHSIAAMWCDGDGDDRVGDGQVVVTGGRGCAGGQGGGWGSVRAGFKAGRLTTRMASSTSSTAINFLPHTQTPPNHRSATTPQAGAPHHKDGTFHVINCPSTSPNTPPQTPPTHPTTAARLWPPRRPQAGAPQVPGSRVGHRQVQVGGLATLWQTSCHTSTLSHVSF